MTYTIKELFYTLQGEGAQAGRAAVFCRFAGCNLWSGREEDRSTAICRFCDTQFVGTDGVGGGKFSTAKHLATAIAALWPGPLDPSLNPIPTPIPNASTQAPATPYVVLTGGEPTLQLDHALLDALHQRGFEVAIETNGTQAVLPGVDWICVSPKAGAPLVQTTGHELKVVVPQVGLDLNALGQLPFQHFFVQAMDSSQPTLKAENLQWAIQYCLQNPQWRLSVQTHKVVGLP